MRHPGVLGGLTTLAIFGLTAALIAFLPINEIQGLTLGLLGFFASCFAGIAVAANRGRHIVGLEGPLDEARFPKDAPRMPLGHNLDHLGGNHTHFG